MDNINGTVTDLTPNIIEAYLAREMANFALENSKLRMHQVTIRTNPGGLMEVKMAAIPRIGDEVTVLQGNRERVYRVVQLRHSAYPHDATLNHSAKKSSVIIWGC